MNQIDQEQAINFKCFIKVKPIPKERPRSSVYVNKFYTPTKTKGYENFIKSSLMFCKQKTRFECSMDILFEARLIFCFTPPLSWSEAKKRAALAGKIRPKIRSDGDNLEKSIWDAAQGVLFHNDNQIIDILREKVYFKTQGVYLELRAAKDASNSVNYLQEYMENQSRDIY